MIDEVTRDVPDSLERWKTEADARAERSKARRLEQERREQDRRARRIVPGKTEWFHATLIVVGMLIVLGLLTVVVVPR